MNDPRRRRRGAWGVYAASAAGRPEGGERGERSCKLYLPCSRGVCWLNLFPLWVTQSTETEGERTRLWIWLHWWQPSPPLPKLRLRPVSHPRRLLGRRKTRRCWPLAPLLPARPDAGWRDASVTRPAQRLPELGGWGGSGGGGVQECGSRQLYCMRGSVWVCKAPALSCVCAWSRETAQDAESPEPWRSWAPVIPCWQSSPRAAARLLPGRWEGEEAAKGRAAVVIARSSLGVCKEGAGI